MDRGFKPPTPTATCCIENPSTSIALLGHEPLFRVDNNLYAGRQAHQVICIRQRIRFVEIIDTPGQPTLRVAPGSKTADMEISYCQYFGGITQAGAYVRPKLSPPVKCPAEKEEWAVSHLRVLQSQVG